MNNNLNEANNLGNNNEVSSTTNNVPTAQQNQVLKTETVPVKTSQTDSMMQKVSNVDDKFSIPSSQTEVELVTSTVSPIQLTPVPASNQVEEQVVSTNEIPASLVSTSVPTKEPTLESNVSATSVASAIPVSSANSGPTLNININDNELLMAFIGKNYEKITTRPFNFAGFFFTTLYMFYRKMFLYAFLIFLVNLVVLNVVSNLFVTFAFNILIGLFINKIYVSHAKKKINNIKIKNSQKSIDELKIICASKGGTSIGQTILGLFLEIVLVFIVLFIMLLAGFGNFLGTFLNPNNWDVSIKENDTTNSDDVNESETKVLEDVVLNGYSCFGTNCTISAYKDGESSNYNFIGKNVELLKILNDYDEYVAVNIYYIDNDEEKVMTKYDAYIKETKESVVDITNEEELRKKIGLYTLGTHSATMTLKEIGMTGFGFDDDKSYTYIDYTFIDEKNIEYEMKYIIANEDGSENINLIENNRYQLTFEVREDIFGYEFYLIAFK